MKAIFLRTLEEIEDKNRALRGAIASPEQAIGCTRFEVSPESFGQVPRSPFAYWVSGELRRLFVELHPLQFEGRVAASGGKTLDDFRWIRLAWELAEGASEEWPGFAKGGAFSRYYADVHLHLDWQSDARALKEYLVSYRSSRGWSPNWTAELHSSDHYFRPGLTWPRRTKTALSVRAMPTGCIFADKGPAAFVAEDHPSDLLAMLAIMNSSSFYGLVELQLAAADARAGGAAHSYEVGVLQRTPVPTANDTELGFLANRARTSWSLEYSLDTGIENSHAFYVPALLQADGAHLADRIAVWSQHFTDTEAELARLQVEVDDLCFELYGINGTDREQIQRGLGSASRGDDSPEAGEAEEEEADAVELDAARLVVSLLSWAVGVALGRFDLRLATGTRAAPPEPEPFDPLPVCSPAMLTGEDGLPLDAPPAGYAVDFPRDGILVDDAGADRDLVAAARQIFEPIFDDPAARWEEAADILADRDRALRGWFAREFFELHIKRYSKSRRKAPLYWQLATHLASYSAWLYYHRFTRDTLFRLLNDHVAPKLQHEERKLTNLTQDAGPNPTASQRKEIDAQETLVGELRAFRVEVAMVAPLWNPNLNDGVILNFAPLWRLVPQHKAWQKECKSAWDKLCKGDYDWAHLAMHLWPERVVPKCGKDRSLAIAHGLEEVFWREDEDGKWQPKTISDEEVAGLVAERTSPAVKAALKSLQEAPAPTAGRARAPRRKKTTTRRAKSATPATAPAESRERPPRQAASTRAVDPAVLEQIRSAIATLGSNAAKSDILDTAGLSASQWTPAINALLADGSVTKTGQKRGTRYHLAGGTS